MENQSTPLPWGKIVSVATNVFLALAGVACLLKGVVTLWMDGDPSMTMLGLAAGLVLLLASSIERFEVLKGLGVEARTRKLDQTISEAAATLLQLRALATSVCHVVFTDLMASNFMGGMPLKRKIEMHDHLVRALTQLGADRGQVAEADSYWKKGVGVIYHRIIHRDLQGRIDRTNTNLETSREARELADDFGRMAAFEEWRSPSPEEMERFLTLRNQLTMSLREWIDDYRHYLEHGEIRRLEEFVKR